VRTAKHRGCPVCGNDKHILVRCIEDAPPYDFGSKGVTTEYFCQVCGHEWHTRTWHRPEEVVKPCSA